jgi:DNA replication protein DnaC
MASTKNNACILKVGQIERNPILALDTSEKDVQKYERVAKAYGNVAPAIVGQSGNLLIIDEVGYLNYDVSASSLLFQVIGNRYEKASTLYTTNLEFARWGQFIGDDTLASAIVDRIAHHAIILNMNGPKGWRLEHARSKQQRGHSQ